MINLSVQQVLSLWAHGTVLRNLTEMWYWIFLWALFSSLFVHGAAGVLMFVMLQRHRQGRVISVIAVSLGFLASVTGAMITSSLQRGTHRMLLLSTSQLCTSGPALLASAPTLSLLKHEAGEVKRLIWTKSHTSLSSSSPRATEPCRAKVEIRVLGGSSVFLGCTSCPYPCPIQQ
uniref:Transmembrane protein 170B n=1 Tax=Oryctolagus cuniculus TaxID=9986 RepID=A0A5F9CV38_RABIT